MIAAAAAFGASVSAFAAPPAPRDIYVWSEELAGFGGFSGLEMTDGGLGFLAVSDTGYLVHATVSRDSARHITKVVSKDHWRFLDNFGRPAEGFQSDAEALRIAPDGSVIVAFEGYARVARFNPPDMMPTPLHDWERFRNMWGNEGFESLAIEATGKEIVILESPLARSGGYRSLVHPGGRIWNEGPSLASDGAFKAVDADFGPDGRLFVLERRFSMIWGYTTRISAYRVTAAGFSAPEILLQTLAGQFGDFEGMDIWAGPNNQTIATLISDDNFLPFEETTIAEFTLAR